jgi:hypothetical protein
MYKTRDTVIKNLKKGVNFSSAKFNLFRNDREIILLYLEQKEVTLGCISPEFYDDYEIVLNAIITGTNKLTNFSPLYYACDNLKNNTTIVSESVKQVPISLKDASDELRNNQEFVLEMLKVNPQAIYGAFTNIKKICQNHDPIKALESFINAQKLNTQLSISQEQSFIRKLKI